MFTDSAKVYIRSGNGGNGHVSFRRELYVPNGGPDGGDGGRGGDIIFEVDDGLNTLVDFRHVRKYAAGNGEEGGKRRCHGADGKDLIVKVPEGTVVKDLETGKVITDMSGDLKGRKGRPWKYALCNSDDAGSEICPAGTAGTGTLGTAGVKGDRGCGTCRIPERRKIHPVIPRFQCETEDRKLPFHDPESAPWRCKSR